MGMYTGRNMKREKLIKDLKIISDEFNKLPDDRSRIDLWTIQNSIDYLIDCLEQDEEEI